MRHSAIMLLLSLLFLQACITMPEEVDEKYVVNETREEAKRLDELAREIIAKNKEKNIAKAKMEKAQKNISVEEGRLSILEEERTLLISKEKQYVLEDDTDNIIKTKELIDKKEEEIRNQKNKVSYSKALRDDLKALYEIEESELAILVAELNLIKATVAKRYQDKLISEYSGDPEKGESSLFKPGEKVEVKKYSAYYEKQKDILQSKKAKQAKTAAKLSAAKALLDKSS